MRNACIAIVLLLTAACGDTKKEFEAGFKSSFEKKFVEGCTKGAVDSGAPEESRPAIAQVCSCTAKKLVERHSVTELTAMGAGSSEDKIQAAIEACRM